MSIQHAQSARSTISDQTYLTMLHKLIWQVVTDSSTAGQLLMVENLLFSSFYSYIEETPLHLQL